MLPTKVTKRAREVILRRTEKLLEYLADPSTTDSIIALQAHLVGNAAWLLAPEFLAANEAQRRDVEARRHFGVCTWYPPCDADAFADGGLCLEHAAEQQRLEAEIDADLAEEGDPDVH